MTREECKRAVLGRIERRFGKIDTWPNQKIPPGEWRPGFGERLDGLMTKHYPPRKPHIEGVALPDYNFITADVLELERKMLRGERG